MTVAEMGEGEQSLPTCAQAPPPGAETTAVFPQTGGEEAEGRTGHVQPGGVNKHVKPLVETDFLVENPSTRGFTPVSGQPASCRSRMKTLLGYRSGACEPRRRGSSWLS